MNDVNAADELPDRNDRDVDDEPALDARDPNAAQPEAFAADSNAPAAGSSPPNQFGGLLSADDLSRAFAHLMGESDGQEASDEPESTTGEGIADRTDRGESVDDEDDSPVTPAAILEAMLFVGHPDNAPLSNRSLASLMRGVSPNEIDELVSELNAAYDEQSTAYHIVSEGEGYRMALRDDLASVRNSFYGRVKEFKLSQSAIDVLSIVAYHQPIERKKIEATFGKSVGGVLSNLVRRDLLALERISDETGRKTVYRTTDRFLQLFGLESIADLPRTDVI